MTTFLGTPVGDVAFDAVLSEDLTASSVVTSNPIETGAEINDHTYVNPKQYTLVAGVTNTPLQFFGIDLFIPSTDQFGDSGGAGRRVSAWDILNQIHEAGEPFTVQAGLETIESMVVTSISAPNDARSAGSLIFTATLQQVILVETEEADIPADQLQGEQTKAQGTSNIDKGKVTKEPATEKSIALQIFEAFGG